MERPHPLTEPVGIRPLFAAALLWLIAVVGPAACAQDADSAQNAKIQAISQFMSGQPSFGVTDSSTVSGAPALKPVGQSMGPALLRVTVGLGLTIILIVGLGWGVRRLGLTGRSKASGGSMDFLEALPLGQNRGLTLVRVLDRVYLLGQTTEGISKLETFEGDRALELISSSKGGVSMAQFKDVFRSFMLRGKKA